jgi:hypothetical protein
MTVHTIPSTLHSLTILLSSGLSTVSETLESQVETLLDVPQLIADVENRQFSTDCSLSARSLCDGHIPRTESQPCGNVLWNVLYVPGLTF